MSNGNGEKTQEQKKDNVVCVVKINEFGQVQWQTNLSPDRLYFILGTIQNSILQPKQNLIKPVGIVPNVKKAVQGAFGKRI
jgi:hypothetical protein